MPRTPRSEVFDPSEVCLLHVTQRCVRRAFLAGKDSVSGKNYEYRREWIRRRLEALAAVFGIDVLAYAILSNHLHLVLRTRPDVIASWSDREVAERWLKLFPGRRLDEYLGQPTESGVQTGTFYFTSAKRCHALMAHTNTTLGTRKSRKRTPIIPEETPATQLTVSLSLPMTRLVGYN